MSPRITSAMVLLLALVVPAQVAECGELQRGSPRGFQAGYDSDPPVPPPDPALQDRSFPVRFDWRDHAGVTAARDQGFGDCYPCWAFAIIGAVESALRVATGQDLDLSEQQLLDCNDRGYGCSGGFLDGWSALADHGAVLESSYPFQNADGACREGPCEPVIRILAAHPVANDPAALKDALLRHGALACGMTVYPDFSFYSGGCYEHPGMDAQNHGVILAGWDDEACGGAGAWLIKNSFGPGWGEDGFAWMRYGTCRVGVSARWYELAPPEEPELHLTTSRELFRPGDPFLLSLGSGVPGEPGPQELYVALEAGGGFWFWPGWSPTACPVTCVLPQGWNRWDLLELVWPEGAGAAEGLLFHSVLLLPGSTEVSGYARCRWEYGP